eukprot:TRINITY_DN26779_c0_g1_i3.p2 TRINITY_DN26779_c0_g1~~TRINITY_DN26779_c0_g1_i3.p2  ORF type:complete len:184 (+),score=4.87 TRINITY_DN26779_c0_g1_i3:151-702(+)
MQTMHRRVEWQRTVSLRIVSMSCARSQILHEHALVANMLKDHAKMVPTAFSLMANLLCEYGRRRKRRGRPPFLRMRWAEVARLRPAAAIRRWSGFWVCHVAPGRPPLRRPCHKGDTSRMLLMPLKAPDRHTEVMHEPAPCRLYPISQTHQLLTLLSGLYLSGQKMSGKYFTLLVTMSIARTRS